VKENEVGMGIEFSNLRVRRQRQAKVFREQINGETIRRALTHESSWPNKGHEHWLKRATELLSGMI